MKFDFFSKGFSKINHVSSFIKFLPLVAELFYDDGRTDIHDDANSQFS